MADSTADSDSDSADSDSDGADLDAADFADYFFVAGLLAALFLLVSQGDLPDWTSAGHPSGPLYHPPHAAQDQRRAL